MVIAQFVRPLRKIAADFLQNAQAAFHLDQVALAVVKAYGFDTLVAL